MDFALSAEQTQLQQSVRGFLEKHSSETEVRRLMDTDEGYDPHVWSLLATEIGLSGLVIPEQYGGSGASWAELGLVLEEMGRALLCAPFFATVVLAATTILESGDEVAKAQLLPRIADGSLIATVALTEPRISVSATRTAGGYVLNGTASYVIDGLVAGVVIVAAQTAAGSTLFVVTGESAGLVRTPLRTLDLTRKLARLDFTDVAATPLGAEGDGARTLDTVLDFAAVGLAAEQAGGAQVALQMAVDYAKLRVQFGQPIGAFQAIKHKCADVLLDVESAISASRYAAWAASERNEEFRASASLAKAFCSDVFVLAAHENIQIHGGIGFTWAVAPHLYFKRAKSSELFFGDPVRHRERLAQRIGM
jgi:alkylation response protein AidB-like acyl-CoA dehydrogenase